MGVSRLKKQQFFAAHPHCCFCGGLRPATTIDHVPNRACFLGRHGPETFEFPACEACQKATRLDEIAFAFTVRMADHNQRNYDQVESKRAISGLVNNHPGLLPNPFFTAREKRRKLAQLGIKKPITMANADIPMVALPPGFDQPIRRYAAKIAAALYYREKGRAVALDQRIFVAWAQTVLPNGQELLESFRRITPFVVQGQRPNIDFGDRFGYRYNKHEDPDILVFLAQFGIGIVIGSMIVPESFAGQTDIPMEQWLPIGSFLTF
jgi:hypothetical protein